MAGFSSVRKIAENAGWDRELLSAELPELAELLVVEGLDIAITGFAPVEIDQITADFEDDPSDPADTVDPRWAAAALVTRPGDLWELGHHRLLCGDARGADDLDRLMEGAQAAMAFLDPPYNVRVRDIVGRVAIAPGFAMLERAKRASHIDPPASSCAIMQRAGPYCGENPGLFTESLNLDPELENRLGQTEKSRLRDGTAGLPSTADIFDECRPGR